MQISKFKALLTKRFSFPKEAVLKKALRNFSPAEKSVFYTLVAIFIFTSVAMLYRVNSAYLVKVPIQGGSVVEGVVGNPRFINPVLALSESDRTLTSLVYSGLMRISESGQVENDLAENVDISDDGLVYTAQLRPDAKFHDGAQVTADDVLFTIQKILDAHIKSPMYGDWSGVHVEKVDDTTVRFVLKKAYAPFISNLTVGILPRHIWKNVTNDEFAFSQFNTLPVGAGPYKVDTVTRNSGGIPDYYELVPFEENTLGTPYISKLIFRFYPSERALLAAYDNGDVDSVSGISPEQARTLTSDAQVLSSPLPRVFGVFFNQSVNQALRDKDVRKALDLAAPKQDIVNDVLQGFGTPIDSPLPPSLFPWTLSEEKKTDSERMEEAAALLAKAGWTKNPQSGILEKKSKSGTITLSFSISTSNAPELRAVAEKLETAWQELGAKVEVAVYETGDLNQSVIRPRKFEALLFGEVVGSDADVYPFWHSSQRNDPGLNIALYANSKVDKILEDARRESDPIKRDKLYQDFNKEIQNDIPVVSLYAPNFIYVVPKNLNAVSLGNLSQPNNRFSGIRKWYVETDNVWKLFVR